MGSLKAEQYYTSVSSTSQALFFDLRHICSIEVNPSLMLMGKHLFFQSTSAFLESGLCCAMMPVHIRTPTKVDRLEYVACLVL